MTQKGLDNVQPTLYNDHMTTTARATNPLRLGRKAKPTRKHKPVIWECMLGTVYAANPAGEVKYFDYKWDEAREWAAITEDSDLRTARIPRGVRYYSTQVASPSPNQWALWAVR